MAQPKLNNNVTIQLQNRSVMLRLTDQLQKIEKAAKEFQDGEKELHKQLKKFHADLEREYVFFLSRHLL